MLSGDAELVAEEIGRRVGVDGAKGGVKPEQKAESSTNLQPKGTSSA